MSSTRTATTTTSSRHRPGPSSGSTSSRSDSKERERDRERAAAAARQAEKETWQRTRGAGSSVLHLYQDPTKSSTSWTEADVLPTLADIEAKTSGQLLDVPSLDLLLSRGIADYTILPKVLGRGKFSTVFMASRYGQLSAIKHTALFPHHQLISTRLLREPTLLAELPPHPNLVEVKETIRTPGHFYLVEEFLGGYVTLEALLPRLAVPGSSRQVLPLAAANTILTQLLSAVRAIHHPLQICHRDIKPENILVHPDTLQLKLLDFGLATHYSKSEAKLTTCCGSPAFHCPEIVRALASQPGTATYWGPEVDAWTCGVTMLRVLTGVRYPLGSNHSSLRNMAIRAQRAVAQIPLFDESATAESGLGVKVRDTVAKLLEMDAVKRMRYFEAMAVETDQQVQPDRTAKSFKSTTFVPTEPAHKMDLPLLSEKAAEKVTFPQEQQQQGAKTPAAAMTSYFPSVPASRRTTPTNSRAPSPAPLSRRGSVEVVAAKEQQQQAQQQQQQRRKPRLIMLNPSNQPPQRVLSFIKYCLRCAGILYHCWPDAASTSPLTTAHRNSWASGAPLSPRLTSSSPDGLSSPPMTPFPLPSTAFDEPRKDGWAHVQLFECVIEYREPPSAEERGAGGEAWATGGRGLVQSIMAAFGRKAAPELKRSESQPSLSPAARVKAQGANGAATNGTATPTGSTSPSSANGIKGLSFHVIVRFPKPPPRASSRPSASRTNTLQQEKRARASSVANAAAASTLFEGGEELVKTATTPTPTTPAPAAEASPPALTTITGSPEFSAPSARPATSAAAATAAATVAVASKAPLVMTPAPAPALPPTPTPTKRPSQMAAPALPPVTAGLSIDTQPEALALRTPGPQTPLTTPSRSRKQSKAAASASAAASAAAARKILIEVSDERALPALRLALAAVGGTTDVVDWVDFAVGGGSTATVPPPPLAHRSLSMFGTASGSSSGGNSSSSGGHHAGGYDSGHATPNGVLSEDGEPFAPTTGDSRKYATVTGIGNGGKPPRAARSQSYFGPRAAAMVAGGARSSMDSTGTTSSLASRGQQMAGGATTPGKGAGGTTTPVRRGTSLSSMATLEVASGEREGERGHDRAASVDVLGGGTPRAATVVDEDGGIERGRGLTRVSPTMAPAAVPAGGSPELCLSAAASEKKQADSKTTLAC